jgi:hypothetical protein
MAAGCRAEEKSENQREADKRSSHRHHRTNPKA